MSDHETQDLNLPGLVRRTALDIGEVDGHKVADALLRDLTADQRKTVLAIVLPDYVRGVLGRQWPPPADDEAAPAVGRPLGQRVKEAYYRELQRVFTTADGPKAYRDLTAEDCEYLAADRDRQAANLLTAAEEFRRAAALLRERGKPSVGALSARDMKSLFGGDS